MKIDDVTLDVLNEVQQEFSIRGDDFSIQEIATIVESQFITANLAFKKGLEVRLPIIGTFQRKHGKEMATAAKVLSELKDVISADEMETRVLQAKLNNINKRKKRSKHMTVVTMEFLKSTPDKVGVKNKFDKIL